MSFPGRTRMYPYSGLLSTNSSNKKKGNDYLLFTSSLSFFRGWTSFFVFFRKETLYQFKFLHILRLHQQFWIRVSFVFLEFNVIQSRWLPRVFRDKSGFTGGVNIGRANPTGHFSNLFNCNRSSAGPENEEWQDRINKNMKFDRKSICFSGTQRNHNQF